MNFRICFLVLCVVCLGCNADTTEYKNRLFSDLLEDYNKYVIPSDGVNVSHGLSLIRIVSLEDQVLTLNTWIDLQWEDQRLAWEPSAYGGLQSINIPAKLVWQPDVILYNSYEPFDGYPGQDLNAIVDSNGTVVFIPQVQTKTFCEHDPIGRGKAVCRLTFGSWTYNAAKINLNPKSDSVYAPDMNPNSHWRYKGGDVKRNVIQYQCCPEVYINLVYTMTFDANE